MQNTIRQWVHRVERRLDRLKHKYKRWYGYAPVIVQPYITYGTTNELWIAGRLLEAKGVEGSLESSRWKNLVHMLRRYQSDEIPFTDIHLTLGDQRRTVSTDADGYFHYQWKAPAAGSVKQPWTCLTLQAADPALPKAEKQSIAEVSVLTDSAEFAVISDVDDTIMRTGATNLFRHTKTVLLNNAHSRELFPGTSEFYNALKQGGQRGPAIPSSMCRVAPGISTILLPNLLKLMICLKAPCYSKILVYETIAGLKAVMRATKKTASKRF
nr:phosphatase domain-containing protein [Salinimonas marina]